MSMPEVPSEDKERAHEKQQTADCSVEYVQSGMVVGWALIVQGQGEAGIVQIRQGIAAWRATGAVLIVPYFCTVLADANAHLGHPEEGLLSTKSFHRVRAGNTQKPMLKTSMEHVREGGEMRRANLGKTPVVLVLAVLLLVGCAAITGRDTPEDARITTEVKARLAADPLVGASGIDVDTSRGVVSLRGSVASEQERQRAIQLAQGVAGVQEIIVRNLLVRR